MGNANVSPYSTQAQVLNTIYSYGQKLGNGFAPGSLGNSALKWEKSEEVNLGLDMGFFNNRLQQLLNCIKRNTKDLIWRKIFLHQQGSIPKRRCGKISNKGIELLLNTQNISYKKLHVVNEFQFFKKYK